MDVTGNIWHRGEDYDILGESGELRREGVPWLIDRLKDLEVDRPGGPEKSEAEPREPETIADLEKMSTLSRRRGSVSGERSALAGRG